uniref:MURF5 n=1 Tax=Leishmania infantum TaxID=5671 RepID=A0A5H3CTM9_LEIIN|nr:MURF5 [Leishmania infantum]QNL34163.1 MURF5 [Leishmania infantum]QNL34175.1 MURF5 [Leishmania infantum]QNL34187.1 MURF5 [Leishmania infantum]QNL34199.1 MURF5 [Leishmania infantum]
MFIYKLSKLNSYNNYKIKLLFNNYIYCIDNYNSIYFNLNGILIWLNILHINIILIKYSFLILLNNLEYLIIFFIINMIYIYNLKRLLSFGRREEREGEEGSWDKDLEGRRAGFRDKLESEFLRKWGERERDWTFGFLGFFGGEETSRIEGERPFLGIWIREEDGELHFGKFLQFAKKFVLDLLAKIN